MRERIAHYRLVSQLGAGGMGVVYRADDERLGRPVAVKVLPADALATEEVRRRFRHEARVLCSLNHPNIATLYDFGEDDGVDYLVMELIAGTTLQQMLSSGSLPLSQVLSVGIQITRALAAAHEVGVVHRDLKPGNVIVTSEGHVKVLDFGLAKEIAGASAATANEVVVTGNVGPLGTLPYMAPEQLRGETPDVRLDVYAAGVVLYEMATGRMPFEQRGALLVDAILNHGPAPPSTHNVVLPRELDSIIVKALDKEPSRRYQSAREMTVDLERLARPTGSVGAPSWTRRASRALTVPALGSVLLLAILLWAAFHKNAPKAAPSAEIHSLAVLPLENLSGDPQQEYFADGMTEELTSVLAQSSSLRVISRTSVMQYKHTTKKIPDIARELGVDAIIEGSVLRAGDRVRITAQLVNAAEDRHLWAKDYDGDLRDVLKVQTDVAQSIANQVRAKLNPRATVAKPVDPRAYDAYLRGKFHAYRKNPDDTALAIKEFEQAISLDSSFAPAYAWLAGCYDTQLTFFDPSDKVLEAKAFSTAQRALELDPGSADAHSELGRLLWTPTQHFDHQAAIREFRRAIALNPNLDEAHHQLGLVYLHIGLFDQALAELSRAVELNPVNLLANYRLGVVFLYQGQYQKALDHFQRVPVEAQPSLVAYQDAWSMSYLGRVDEALDLTAKFIVGSRDEGGLVSSTEAILYAKKGDRRAAESAIKAAIAKRGRYIHFHHTAYNIASAYAILGDTANAMKWLRSAADDGYPCFPLFAQDPHLAKLRSNREFQAFLADQKLLWEKNRSLAAEPSPV